MKWILTKVRFLGLLTVFFGSLVVLAGVAIVAAVLTIPDVGILEKCFTTSMYEVKLCPGGDNYVRLKDISPHVLHAVIASEDGSFYNHKGFDWHEIKESMQANLQSGGFRRGGSTLTQQLAKNIFLDKDKSLVRKLKEAYLASAIENRFDKSFILEKYLNVVEFGPNIYGVKPAAQHYFHKAPSALNPLEAAWLAMLLPNPKKYSQSFRAGKLTPYARKQVKVILKRMESFGKLSPVAYQTSLAHVDEFPWNGLGLAAFGGAGTFSLDTNVPAAKINEAPADENDIENVLDEDDRSGPAPSEPSGESTEDFN